MSGSIGNLAEQVLREVRSGELTKLAQHEILRDTERTPKLETEIGKALYKAAQELRNNPDEITVSDVEEFLGVLNAK